MSDPRKEKLCLSLLKGQLEAIGVKNEGYSSNDLFNSVHINQEELEKSCKEDSNKSQEIFENNKVFSVNGTENYKIIMSSEENKKDKMNNEIKTLKGKRACEEDAENNKKTEFKESSEFQMYLTKDQLEMIVKEKVDEEMSKRFQMPLSVINHGMPKCGQCLMDKQDKADLHMINKSLKSHKEDSNLQPYTSLCKPQEKDNKLEEESSDDQTIIKERYMNVTIEEDQSTNTGSTSTEGDELTSDCLFDDESSGLHDLGDIELESNFVSFFSDTYMSDEDKVEADMNQSEKSLEGKMLEKIAEEIEEVFLSDLPSLGTSDEPKSKFFHITYGDELQNPDKNYEKSTIALSETMDCYHPDLLSSTFSSDSCGYHADDSCVEERVSWISYADTSSSFTVSNQDKPFRFEITDSCREEELKNMLEEEPDKLSLDGTHWNELSSRDYQVGSVYFQNNIVFTTMDANVLGSLQTEKCKSKDFSVTFTASVYEMSYSSNSFYCGPEKVTSFGISGFDETVKNKNGSACVSSFQVSINDDLLPKVCKNLNPDSVIKENECHEKDLNGQNNEGNLLAPNISKYVKYKKMFELTLKKKEKTDRGRKRKHQGNKKDNKICTRGNHHSNKHVTKKRPKNIKENRSHHPNKGPELLPKNSRQGHHFKGQGRYNWSYLFDKKQAHQDLHTGKVRKHTGDHNGGSRSSGSSGGGGRGTRQHQQGSGSSRGFQGSRGSSHSSGSGGDHPDDHNSRRGKEYNAPNSRRNDDDEEEEEEDNYNKKTKKKKASEASDYSHKNSLGGSHAHAPFPLKVSAGRESSSYSGALPNLPPPVWDNTTKMQRQTKERKFLDSLKIYPPMIDKGMVHEAKNESHRRESAPNLTSASAIDTPTEYLSVPRTAPVTGKSHAAAVQNPKHAVISAVQLCEVIGYATNNAEVPPELFENFNICFTKVMHDLNFGLQESDETSQAQQFTASSTSTALTNEFCTENRADNLSASAYDMIEERMKGNLPQVPELGRPPSMRSQEAVESPLSSLGCTVCLAVSGLISHLSNDRLQVCMPCSQVLNLMTQHARSCVAKGRPRQRITSSDLCYKICKKAGWCVEKIICDSASFKGKIQKYCDKALCKNTKSLADSEELDVEFSFGIGEMESMKGSDALSCNTNNSSSISLSGNPVALESDNTPSPCSSKLDKEYDSCFVSNTIEISAPNSLSSSQIGFQPINQASVSAVGVGVKAHRNLSRKGSHRSPAIPQPIEEESIASESGQAGAEGQDIPNEADIRDFIYKRYGPKGIDPYDTQPTFGDKKGYESMPLGNLHDQEQFMSFGNRAVGVPGIGEVVFGNLKQLRLVAGFWEKKREDCERTRTTPPYQHREEGVILSQYKGYFNILRTRYQKHQQWERVAHLGNGMSGKCHLAKDLITGFKFCCKKVHLLKYSKEEVNLWSELKHRYIVKLYGVLRHGVKIYVFCEFIDGGSLAACIEEQRHLKQRFSHWAAINYFQQLLKVLAYLQSLDILHEDIKADNILLRGGCTSLALTDFGTCRRLCDPKELLHKSPVGSPAHWSPEKAASEGHGFPSDLWAAVCVLIHMLSGDPPWLRRFMKSATILNFIIYSREPPLEDVPPDVQPMVRDLIASGLVKDAEKRPNAETLLCHGAFRILAENKQPDRYYSTLGGVSQAPFLTKINHDEKGPQILFSADISTGPYQESAGPSAQSTVNEFNNMEAILANEENTLGIDHLTSPIDNQESKSHSEDTAKCRKGPIEEGSDSQLDNLPKRLNEASSRLLDQNSYAVSARTEAREKCTHVDKKPQKVPDLDNLLSSLFVPDESKAFYTDDIPDGVEALMQSTVKQQKLEVFVPEVSQESQIPNLSIFGMDFSDGSGQGGSNTIIPRSLLEMAEPPHNTQYNADPLGNESLRPALSSARVKESFNGVNFSSGTESFTSADLFEQGSMAEPETIKNKSVACDPQPPLVPSNWFSNTNEKSPHNDHGNPLTLPSMTTNLQQRKPDHIRLNFSPTGSPLPPHTEGEYEAISNKVSLLGQLSHKTPSTGRLSAASSSNRLGGSSTSGSRRSPTPFHFNMPGVKSSVKEEQEKLMQVLKAEQESLSSSGSELFTDEQAPAQEYNAPDKMADGDWELALSKLRENIEISSLEGHELEIIDEESMKVVLLLRFMETPVSKKQLIDGVSGKLSVIYGHFSLFHLDKFPLKFNTPLKTHKLLVRKLPEPQRCCLCEICRAMF